MPQSRDYRGSGNADCRTPVMSEVGINWRFYARRDRLTWVPSTTVTSDESVPTTTRLLPALVTAAMRLLTSTGAQLLGLGGQCMNVNFARRVPLEYLYGTFLVLSSPRPHPQ
jgi:hypothetical protein